MATKKISGKASGFVFNGHNIKLTKYSLGVERKLADTSDTADYDTASDMLYASQVPTKLTQTLDVEGWIDMLNLPQNLIATLYTGAAALLVTLNYDAGTLCGHGLFDVSNFKADVPTEDTISFTCTLMGNGIFTPNA